MMQSALVPVTVAIAFPPVRVAACSWVDVYICHVPTCAVHANPDPPFASGCPAPSVDPTAARLNYLK